MRLFLEPLVTQIRKNVFNENIINLKNILSFKKEGENRNISNYLRLKPSFEIPLLTAVKYIRFWRDIFQITLLEISFQAKKIVAKFATEKK